MLRRRIPFQTFLLLLGAICILTISQWARAGDIDAAKKYLDKAKQQLKDSEWNSIEETLKAVDEFLDGVPDVDKAPVAKELADVKSQAATGLKKFKADGMTKSIDRELGSAADDVLGNPASAVGRLDRIKQMMESEDGKKYLDADVVKKYTDRMAGLQKMAGGKIKKQKLDFLAPIIKELDDALASDPFKGKNENEADQVVQQLKSLMSRIRGGISDMPADDADVKAINDKLAAADKKITVAAAGAMKGEEIAKLQNWWKSTQEYYAGWEKETQGPTWERFSHEAGQEMSVLMMPKTVEAADRVRGWLREAQVIEARKTLGTEPAVKAIFDEADKTLDSAAGKLSGAFNALLGEAEKLPVPSDDLIRKKPGYMVEDGKRFFADTKYLNANVARAQKLDQKWVGAMEATAKGQAEAYDKLVAAATAAWPGIAASLKPESGFTPAEWEKYKGKLVKIVGRNRIGWDYGVEDYNYAVAINGMPVAGKYDPKVRAAIDAIRAATNRDLPEEEKWEVYGIIEGKGLIKENASADIKDNGGTVGRIEGKRTVDCAVMKIIAVHIGPVAIGPAGGVAIPADMATPVAVTGTPAAAPAPVAITSPTAAEVGGTIATIIAWLFRIVFVVIMLAAAGAVYVKAKPQAVPVNISSGSAGAVLKGDTLAIIGLVFAAIGALALFSLAIFPSLALIASGLYLASDLLLAKGMLKANQYAKLKPLGIIIAGTTAGLALLHLIAGGYPLL